MTKIVKKTLRCGTTGEFYTVNQLVEIKSQDEEAIQRRREATDAQIDREIDREVAALNHHRRIRPDVQKIGWKR